MSPDATPAQTPRWPRFALIALTIFAALARLFGVSRSPPGFYVDEAAIGAQVLCVAQSGANLQGEHWPMFTEVLGGGLLTPTYLYTAVGWVSLFGGSIESFRLLAAVCSLIFLAGVFVFARRAWASSEAAWLATLAAAVSPWVFQFARIGWDPALAPAFLVWALAMLWGKARWELALSGGLFALAAYTYPPLRVQIAIVLPLAILYLAWRRREWKPWLLTVVTALVTSLPLLVLTLNGEIQTRFAALSVFNPQFLHTVYGETNPLNGLRAIVGNIGLLLSPGYLLVHGDANLRHSTSAFGIWSWLDALALVAAFALLARCHRTARGRPADQSALALAALLTIGYVAGILPAAMTWESNPHALRSIGATVFLAVSTGGVLAVLWQRHRLFPPAILATAAVFFGLFLGDYFGTYPRRAAPSFDTAVSETATRLAVEGRIEVLPAELTRLGIHYPPMALRYYGLRSGVERCH
ncbi:MAG: glycosyltransferase family 39 protein [Pseudomarimonas sp.]